MIVVNPIMCLGCLRLVCNQINKNLCCVLNTCNVFGLFQTGLLSAEDIDKLCYDGLGVRYAFIGPLQTMHLNADGLYLCLSVKCFLWNFLQNRLIPENFGLCSLKVISLDNR